MHKESLLGKIFREILIAFLLAIYPLMTLLMWLIEKKTGEKI